MLFGNYEHALASPKTQFIPSEPFPRISELAKVCSEQNEWACITNCDILFQNIPVIERMLIQKGAVCAMSMRYQFEDGNPVASIVDNGLDFFCAHPMIWLHVFKEIPRQYRIANCLYDTWLMGFFCAHYFNRMFDVTECRAVYHPKHEERRRNFAIDASIGEGYCAKVKWPFNKISL